MKHNLNRFLGISLILGLSLLTISAVVPNNVVTAEKSLSVWVNELKGKSEAEVVKQLGAPAEKTTWNFMGSNPPLMHFNTPGGGKISVYFANDKAVTISYLLLSK